MMQIEQFNDHSAHSLAGPRVERAPLNWALEASARAAEREAERAELAKLTEALSLLAHAWEREKAEWKDEVEKLRRETVEAREALAATTQAASEARAASARAAEARENDRVLYQTDRTSWANERRQLQKAIEALKKEAARGWLARLVRGAGAI